MNALEQELVDLGEYLDVRDNAELPAQVLRRLSTERRSMPLWVKVAAAIVVAVGLAVTLPPTRRALARWLGIGAVSIQPVATTLPVSLYPDHTVPGAVVPTSTSTAPASTVTSFSSDSDSLATAASTLVNSPSSLDPFAAIRGALNFAPLVAGADAGPILGLETDKTVPGGLVALTYSRFTLVELASEPGAYPIIAKLAPPDVTVTFTKVNGVDGVWIEGAHEIAYLAPDGSVRKDTVRRSGNVLLWTVGSVTVRIEGIDGLDEAKRLATAVH